MDKKNILLLIIGVTLYSIGFISFNFIGKIAFTIGGILLSVLFIRLGKKISEKNKFIGKSLKIFGIAYIVILLIMMPVAILVI